jgi:hypothetical protein
MTDLTFGQQTAGLLLGDFLLLGSISNGYWDQVEHRAPLSR